MDERDHDTWVYFDGNAASTLWDWHTKVTGEGQTGDSRSESPFSNAVLSDFALDEMISIPVSNAFKKHLALLTIFPDIPVLLPLEQVDINDAEHDRSILVRESNFLPSVAGLRARALIGDLMAVSSLEQDIDNKKGRIAADVTAAQSRMHVQKPQRIDLEQAIALAVREANLEPGSSSVDFFKLCKRLYEFEISRLIDRPSAERKGASRQLNQQIDYYHLSYLPFVNGFVTDDRTLRSTALVLSEQFHPSTSIYSVDEYHRSWIRNRLQAD